MDRSKAAPRWRRGFLRALSETGSVALAAERAGIDRTTAYGARRTSAAFASSWARALSGAREALANGSRSTRLRGDEIIRSSKHGAVCVARAGPGRWSARVETEFLEQLAASANVQKAADAVGVSTTTVYARRMKWPAFAEGWRAAIEQGHARIETLLVMAATDALDPVAATGAREAPAMTVEQAMNLFKLHRAEVKGGPAQRYGWRMQLPPIEEVRAEVLRKIAVMSGEL